MRTMTIVATMLCTLLVCTARAEIKMETVEYKAGDMTLKGYLAYDDQIEGTRPGVVLVHEWWGLNEFVKEQARRLADAGYVAFAADIYGEGKTTTSPEEAAKWSGQFRQDPQLAHQRFRAAVETLRKHERVDDELIAATGYCFGGTMVLNMARMGADLDGVVSFHGGLGGLAPARKGDVKAKVLVLHGEADPLVPPQQVEEFKKSMDDAGADYRIVTYPNAKHAFTNPNADKVGMDAIGYNEEAAKKSWDEMLAFLKDLFNGPTPQ